MGHSVLPVKTVDDILHSAKKNGLKLSYSNNINILKEPLKIGKMIIPNRLCIHPIEGCDSTDQGAPGELTMRRYTRFAEGGSGLIWHEAASVCHEGLGNPRQWYLHEKNTDKFKLFLNDINEKGIKSNGFKPINIIQATHSGRFSKPNGKPEPVIAYHNPYLNERMNLDADYPVITDDELKRVGEDFIKGAVIAKNAGFDGVDIKVCHRYLLGELFSAYNRKGAYGGSFENRIKLFLDIIDAVQYLVDKNFIITTRINLYDGIAYPFGFGVDRENVDVWDKKEPFDIIKLLFNRNIRLVNITMGTPYFNPHVNRPYEFGLPKPKNEPITGVARLLNGAADLQKEFPEMAVIGTGYSWFGANSAGFAAGAIENDESKLIGFGRMSLAYPNFANDIFEKKVMDRHKSCITCGKCSELMRNGQVVGCVVRDKYYTELYQKMIKNQ